MKLQVVSLSLVLSCLFYNCIFSMQEYQNSVRSLTETVEVAERTWNHPTDKENPRAEELCAWRESLVAMINEKRDTFLIKNNNASAILTITRDDTYCYEIPSRMYRCCWVYPVCMAACCCCCCDEEVINLLGREHPDFKRAKFNVIKAIALTENKIER